MAAAVEDTIFALASGAGASGVAVIRVSGPQAFAQTQALCGRVPEPGRHALRKIHDRAGELIDEGLVLSFAKGASFTGEDVVELQTHGSPAVVARLLHVLGETGDMRLAEAGEFTRRAFENGRLDLTQVEALAALIEAETEAQRKLAMEVFGGALSTTIADLRASVLRAAALCEATIDFADEEVPEDVNPEVRDLLSNAIKTLEMQLSGSQAAQSISKGIQIAILGPTNAGKSSLINAIAGKDIAIVSEIAGTTRDIVELTVNLGGQKVTFLDTAGIRDTKDAIELEGIRRAKERAENADIRLLVSPDDWIDEDTAPGPDDILVYSKGDLTGRKGAVSTDTGDGIDELLEKITTVVSTKVDGGSLIAELRQEKELSDARAALATALVELDNESDMELVAHQIRDGLRYLARTIGAVGVEDVLGEIFSSFCIGK